MTALLLLDDLKTRLASLDDDDLLRVFRLYDRLTLAEPTPKEVRDLFATLKSATHSEGERRTTGADYSLHGILHALERLPDSDLREGLRTHRHLRVDGDGVLPTDVWDVHATVGQLLMLEAQSREAMWRRLTRDVIDSSRCEAWWGDSSAGLPEDD